MKLFALTSTNPEEKVQDGAVQISIYSTRELAIDAFEKQWVEWNSELDAEFDADQFVPASILAEFLEEDGFVEVFTTYFTISEFELDDGSIVNL